MEVNKSKTAAWGGLILTCVVIVLLMVFHLAWWMFIPFFFMFMAAFTEFAATYLQRISPYAAKRFRNVPVGSICWRCSVLS